MKLAVRDRRSERGRVAAHAQVAFLGLFGVGNMGNEASLSTGLQAARARGLSTVCLCANPERVGLEHDVSAHSFSTDRRRSQRVSRNRLLRLCMRILGEPSRLLRAYRMLRDIDALVVPGTGVLDDFGVRPWDFPYDLARWSLLCRLARARFGLVAIGAGPIERRGNRFLMKMVADQADYCSYRDEGSRAYMAGMGCDTSRADLVPDIVFSSAPASATRLPSTDGSLVVGLGVMSYWGWSNRSERGSAAHEHYLAQISAFGRFLLRDGFRIRLLMGEDSDLDAITDARSRILAGSPESFGDRVTASSPTDLEGLRRDISRCDIVVATRFHNVVAALLEHRPVLSVGYAAKNDELLDKVGLADFSQRIETLDVDRLIEQFQMLAARREQISTSLVASVNLLHDQALAAWEAAWEGLSLI